MSGIYASQMAQSIVMLDDRRNVDNWFKIAITPDDCPWLPGMLWTASRNIMGDAMTTGMDNGSYPSSWEYYNTEYMGGSAANKRITGTTRNATGSPLGNVTVNAFLTAGNVYVGTVVSDSSGWFSLITPYPGQAHFLECYLSGSPDVSGVSVNTLIPS